CHPDHSEGSAFFPPAGAPLHTQIPGGTRKRPPRFCFCPSFFPRSPTLEDARAEVESPDFTQPQFWFPTTPFVARARHLSSSRELSRCQGRPPVTSGFIGGMDAIRSQNRGAGVDC